MTHENSSLARAITFALMENDRHGSVPISRDEILYVGPVAFCWDDRRTRKRWVAYTPLSNGEKPDWLTREAPATVRATEGETAMTTPREIRPVGWGGPTGAIVTRHLRAWVPLDNYTPARTEAVVMLEEYHWPPSDDGFTGVEYEIIGGVGVFKHFDKALWILDFDKREPTQLMHTATWHPEQHNIGLKTFPAGLIGGFGPRTTYHLMVTEI